MEIELLLEYIQAHWRKNQPAQLSRGVWVALHEELDEAADEASTPVIRAWFVTDRAIAEYPPLSFKLFAENKVKVRVNESHGMGESNIAPYPEGGIYYMDCISGPLAGGGMKVEISQEKVTVKERLWSA